MYSTPVKFASVVSQFRHFKPISGNYVTMQEISVKVRMQGSRDMMESENYIDLSFGSEWHLNSAQSWSDNVIWSTKYLKARIIRNYEEGILRF